MASFAGRLPGWLKGGLFVLIGMLLGMATIATVQAQGEEVIIACADRNGVLRVVESSDDCRPNETSLEWNVQGPRGPGVVEAFATTLSPGGEATANLSPIVGDPEGDFQLELGIPQGEQGPQGERDPGVTEAEATTVGPDSPANAELVPISGDPEGDLRLILELPQGEPGEDGLHCWDLDEDGVADPEEDTNGDGAVDVNDRRPDISGGELPTARWFIQQNSFTEIDSVFPTFTELRSVPLPPGNHLVISALQLRLSDTVIGSTALNARVHCRFESTGVAFGDSVFVDLATTSGTFGYSTGGWHEATLYGVVELTEPGSVSIECAAQHEEPNLQVETQAIVATELGEVIRSFSP